MLFIFSNKKKYETTTSDLDDRNTFDNSSL